MLHIVVSVYFVTVTASLATHPFLPGETIFVGDLQFRDSTTPEVGWCWSLLNKQREADPRH